jgi:hypothetical protein
LLETWMLDTGCRIAVRADPEPNEAIDTLLDQLSIAKANPG